MGSGNQEISNENAEDEGASGSSISNELIPKGELEPERISIQKKAKESFDLKYSIKRW